MARTLAISGHFRPNQLVGGVASFFQNLTYGIAQVVDQDPRFGDVEATVFHGPAGTPGCHDGLRYREAPRPLGRFAADTWYGLFESDRFDASLFPNYFTPPVVRSRRTVAVIHDLLYKNMPEFVSWKMRLWLDRCERRSLRRCDAVATISAAVKNDVVRWFGVKHANKIRPIWNPIAVERLEHGEFDPVGGHPYFLGVAVDRPFKNLATLIHAFARVRAQLPEHRLVLAGELRSRRPKGNMHSGAAAARMPSTVDLVNQLGLQDEVAITGFVSDAQLGALYRGADAFVLPSLFEGFGMPAIEALALGTPTIVSDIPPLREITLGAGRFVADPLDDLQLAEALVAVAANVDAARPTRTMISEIRNRFSPRTIAKQYLELLFPE